LRALGVGAMSSPSRRAYFFSRAHSPYKLNGGERKRYLRRGNPARANSGNGCVTVLVSCRPEPYRRPAGPFVRRGGRRIWSATGLRIHDLKKTKFRPLHHSAVTTPPCRCLAGDQRAFGRQHRLRFFSRKARATARRNTTTQAASGLHDGSQNPEGARLL